MRHSHLVKTTLCFGFLLAACGHPAGPGTTTGGGTGGSGTGTGGSGTGGDNSGNGGSATGGSVGTGTGGAGPGMGGAGPGAGGTGSPTGGTGGSGSPTGGTGGTGEVIIPPDAGVVAPPTKTACVDSPTLGSALKYTPGYVISDAAKTAAANAVSNMTPTQKADQLRGKVTGTASSGPWDVFDTADSGTLKGWKFHDGPRGVNLDQTKGSIREGYSTVFPVAMSRGAAFDIDLEYTIGQAMGDEMVASGNTMILAPTVNILRHPAWGRAQETYGEDSFLLGRLGTAYTVGVQEYVAACVKHFAANNVEWHRDLETAVVSDQTLHDTYVRHFAMILQDAGAACVMAAYNRIQLPGAPAENCTQSKRLLTDILRTELGFKGMVLSDWWAIPGGSGGGGDRAGIGSTALNAGLDLELPWNLYFQGIEGTATNTAAINTAALRVVTEKFRFKVNGTSGPIGLKPATSTFNAATHSIQNNDAHIALALKAAVEGTVLLKNDANTLPIKPAVKNVAVIGQTVNWVLNNGQNPGGTINFATTVNTGDRGSSRANHEPAKSTSPFQGIQANAPMGVTVTSGNGNNAATDAAVAVADFVVIVAGLTPQDEAEEYTIIPQNPDRNEHMGLDANSGGMQNAFVTKYAAQAKAANKPFVVVLEAGSSVDLPWIADVPAIVMAWYPGQQGGAALGQLLFGKANFSGKLPLSWPKSTADLTPFKGASYITPMDYNTGYRWFDGKGTAPLFPFGHGLSYTTFQYANVAVPCTTATAKSVVTATVDVTNTGTVAGEEVVLLFASYPGSKLAYRPANYKELKGFARVQLNPGQTKRVPIPVRVPDLSYWDAASKTWRVEPGTVKIMIGPSAAADKLMLNDTFTVQ